MKRLYKRLKETGLIIVAVITFGFHNASALVPMDVFDINEIMEEAQQYAIDAVVSELESQANQILSKKLTDLGFGEMAGEVFGPVLGPLAANNPYMQQLQGSLGSLEDMAKDTAKASGQCVVEAKKARMEAIKKYKKECKENNKEDEVEEKKCIEDAKDRVKKIEKDALAICKAELNKKTAEISAAAKQQAKDMGDSMKKDYENTKTKVNSATDKVKNTFNWKKKDKDKEGTQGEE